jgi:hypothetical protein
MIKDTVLQNNLRFHPVRNLSGVVEKKLNKGFQKIFSVSCESNGVDPIEWIRKVEEDCLFVLDGLGTDAKLYSLVNKAGNLHADGQYHEWETSTGAIKVGDGSGLRTIPQLKSGEYVVTNERSNSSLGVRLQAKEVIGASLEYYIDNPPVDPIDGRGDSSYMTDGFWDGLTRIPQETSEEVYRSLPETTETETEPEISVTSFSGGSSATKKWLLSDKELRSKAPRGVLLEVFQNKAELNNILLDDRES